MSSVVIVGAGIIGCATAKYLAESQDIDPKSIHLVESSEELFASASGKAGGFLAADWFTPDIAPLGALSFKLHKELSDKNNGRERWGYSFSTGTSFAQAEQAKAEGGGKDDSWDWLIEGGSRAEVAGEHEFKDGTGPSWLTRRDGDSVDVISADDTAAQLDPLKLSQYLLSECQRLGVQLHQPAQAVSISTDSDNVLSGVRIRRSHGNEEIELPCTSLLLTSGAWTPRVFRTLFPQSRLRIPISQLAGHSLVVRSPRWTSAHETDGCHAVFSTSASGFSPELISRVGGDIYVAGLNSDTLPLPELASDASVNEHDVAELKKVAIDMLGVKGTKGEDLEVVRSGVCFRPVTASGKPIVSGVADGSLGGVKTGSEGGVFVAAGHGPWGISLSLGTGLVMSDMITGKKTTVNVKGLETLKGR